MGRVMMIVPDTTALFRPSMKFSKSRCISMNQYFKVSTTKTPKQLFLNKKNSICF